MKKKCYFHVIKEFSKSWKSLYKKLLTIKIEYLFFYVIFLLFVCFCVFFYINVFTIKNELLFFTLVLHFFSIFFFSDIASSSGKQKSTRPTPSRDEDLQNILDILDNDDDHDDDSTLADTDIEDGDSDDNDEDTETNFVNIGHNDVGTNIN